MQYYDKFTFNAIDEKCNPLDFKKVEIENGYKLILDKSKLLSCKSVRALGEFTQANSGEEGYYLISRSYRQKGDIQTFFKEREDCVYRVCNKVASCCCVKKADLSCLIRIKRNYRYEFEVALKDGRYSLSILYNFCEANEENCVTNEEVCEDIEIEVIFLPVGSDYPIMAKKEREIRLARKEITLLSEKCEREVVEYSRKYPLVRIRMGWKESPSPVLCQSEENEPPMKVVCTFKRVREIALEMKRQGIEGADIQLVGWNKSGHDGRFPQFFPVDERLGGEEEMRKTIDCVKSLGYKISTHTVFTDAYEVADNFDWDDIVVKKSGEYEKFGPLSGGWAYRVCQIKQLKNAKRELPSIAMLGENGLHYVDVLSLVLSKVCYGKGHECNLCETIEKANELAVFVRSLFGGFSSEGCLDCMAGNLDFGLYISFGTEGKEASPLIDEYVPFYELIYHGILLYNPLSETINSTIKEPDARLKLALFGGRPVFYIYSKFRNDGHNWMGNEDLFVDTDEQMKKSVCAIKKGIDDYAIWRDKQTLFMENYYDDGNGVKATTYSDGSKVVVNFSDTEKVFEGVTIKSKGIVVI